MGNYIFLPLLLFGQIDKIRCFPAIQNITAMHKVS
jgi:hypothetical protein